jgi:hypothetical protein
MPSTRCVDMSSLTRQIGPLKKGSSANASPSLYLPSAVSSFLPPSRKAARCPIYTTTTSHPSPLLMTGASEIFSSEASAERLNRTKACEQPHTHTHTHTQGAEKDFPSAALHLSS